MSYYRYGIKQTHIRGILRIRKEIYKHRLTYKCKNINSDAENQQASSTEQPRFFIIKKTTKPYEQEAETYIVNQ